MTDIRKELGKMGSCELGVNNLHFSPIPFVPDPDHAAASTRAEAGITSSAAHAEADAPGWSDHAMALLGRYSQALHGCHRHFTMEKFRLWAYEHGLARPAEERCWGAVTQKALRQGLIVKVGYAAAASSNNSPKATYRGVV